MTPSRTRSQLLAAALLAASTASADPSAADRANATKMMMAGDAKMKAKDAGGALEAYQSADAIMHVPTTTVAVARAQLSMGQFIEAKGSCATVASFPAKPAEPRPFVSARAECAKITQEASLHIATIRLKVSGLAAGATATTTLDGNAIGADGPREIKAGHHVLVASAPGYADARVEITAAEGQSQEVSLALSPAAASAPPPPPPPTNGPVASQPQDVMPPPSSSHGVSPLVYVGFGVGGVGIILGAVTGAISLSKASDVKSQCNTTTKSCPASAQSESNTSRSLGTVSTISFIVGGAGVATGIIGLFLPGPSTTSAKAGVQPYLGLGAAGVAGRF